MCFNIVNIGLGLVVSGKTRKILGEMPAINRHKHLHCAYSLAHANCYCGGNEKATLN